MFSFLLPRDEHGDRTDVYKKDTVKSQTVECIPHETVSEEKLGNLDSQSQVTLLNVEGHLNLPNITPLVREM